MSEIKIEKINVEKWIVNGVKFDSKKEAEEYKKDLPYEDFVENLMCKIHGDTVYSLNQSDLRHEQMTHLKYFLVNHDESIRVFLNKMERQN